MGFVHGDDPCIVDGKHVYEAAIKAGRFKTIPRTEGISTTDIVGRLLMLTKDHHTPLLPEKDPDALSTETGSAAASSSSASTATGVFLSQQSKFLVTSQLMQAFPRRFLKQEVRRDE